MKELHIEKFDALLSLAAAECIKDEAIAFVSADISGVEDNPRMLRKILGKFGKSRWKALKIIALVALLCMSIAFTACMLVPEIRNVIWNAFVKEYGDHVEVEFDSSKETEIVTDAPMENYPKTIEKKAQLLYQLDEWLVREESSVPLQYTVFFLTDTYEFKCQFSQSIIDAASSYIDNEAGQIAYVSVNNYKAILIEHDSESEYYSLIWQDSQYRYTLYGSFTSISELVKIAESVRILE